MMYTQEFPSTSLMYVVASLAKSSLTALALLMEHLASWIMPVQTSCEMYVSSGSLFALRVGRPKLRRLQGGVTREERGGHNAR